MFTRLLFALIAAVILLVAPAPATAQIAGAGLSPETAAWADSIDYSAIRDPRGSLKQAEEKAFFTHYMIENFKSWSPGKAPFDIAVPAPFYAKGDRLFAFDVFARPNGDPDASYISWEDYAMQLSQVMANMSEFNVDPNPTTLQYGRNENVAWMSMQVRVTGHLESGQTITLPIRNSLVLERSNDQWLIVHEHVSTPFIPVAS